jgi:hypothetical protein
MMCKKCTRKSFVLAILLLFPAAFIQAQQIVPAVTPLPVTPGETETEAGKTDSPGPTQAPQSLYESTLKIDIESASYYELYAWCQELGLATAGVFNDLRQRLLQYYKIPVEGTEDQASGNGATGKPGTKTIIIKSASDSEYFKVEEIDENYLVLKGDVAVEVVDRDQDVIHQIKAKRIVLNQTQNFITAEENVEYGIIRSGGKPEVFKGESFSFNLNTWDGVFYKGIGTTSGEVKEGQSIEFTFYGNTITRLSNDTVILDEGGITSSHDKEDPYWQIKATKIIVLAPGEWTIANAVLCIGRVPLLYIPFFFYPGDELFFSPVIGYRDREGTFLQTTTYFLGKKEKKKSPFSFLRATEDTQTTGSTEIHGLFLRNVKSKTPQAQPQNKDWVTKLMVDLYSRLGGFAGVNMNFPPAFKLNGGVGVSRSLYPFYTSSGTLTYTVFSPDDNVDHWNTLNFFGYELPIRFGLDTSFTTSLFENVVALSGNMEIYSDPFFPTDFYSRKEDMDFSKLFGLSQADIQAQTQVPSKLQFTWYARSILSLSKFMPAPVIRNLSVNYLNMELSWSSKNVSLPDAYSPFRMFYFPDRLIAPNWKTTIEGDIFSVSTARTGSVTDNKSIQDDPGRGFRLPDEIKDPQAGAGAQSPDEAKPDLVLPDKRPDVASLRFGSRDSSFTLSYSIAPLLELENQFDTEQWKTIEQVNYSFKYSRFINEVPFSLISLAKIYGDYIRFENKATMNESFRVMFNRASRIDDSAWNQLQQSDYAATYVRLTDNSLFTLKPFLEVYGFQNSLLNYRLNWMFYNYKNTAPSGDSPLFGSTALEWTKDTVSLHSLDSTIRYQTDAQPVTFTAATTLPPIDPKIDSTIEFYIWLLKTNGSITLRQYADVWQPDPFSVTETFDFAPICALSGIYMYDYRDAINPPDISLSTVLKLLKLDPASPYLLEQELAYDARTTNFTRYRALLTISAFRSEFVAEKIPPLLNFDNAEGTLVLDTANPIFVPNYLSDSFNSKIAEFAFWKQRIFTSLSLNTTAKYVFQRFSDSSFTFNLTFNFEIAEFLTIVFTSESYNNNIYRYIPGVPEIVETQWINPVVDLVKSFNFFNSKDRMESNFKISKLSISVMHKMYDWDLGFDFSGIFQKDTSLNTWIWMPTFSISVRWHDIPEIKKEMKGDNKSLNIWT